MKLGWSGMDQGTSEASRERARPRGRRSERAACANMSGCGSKRDQQGSNGKNDLVGRPLVRFFEPAARSVPPLKFRSATIFVDQRPTLSALRDEFGRYWLGLWRRRERRLRGSLRTGS